MIKSALGTFFICHMTLNTAFGTKQHLLQTWNQAGVRLPVTVIKTAPMTVKQIKTKAKDGYQAIRLSFMGYLREIRTQDSTQFKVGDQINITDILKPGDKVNAAGLSKGRGFSGVVKRWGFAGGPKTHGQSDRHRAPGSIGQGTDPGRVHKGKKMPGRYGGVQANVRNLELISIHPEKNELWIKGQIPGHRNSLIKLTKVG